MLPVASYQEAFAAACSPAIDAWKPGRESDAVRNERGCVKIHADGTVLAVRHCPQH